MSHLNNQVELCIEAMQANYGIPFDDVQMRAVIRELQGNQLFATTLCARCAMSQLLVDVVFPGDMGRVNWTSAVKIGLRCDKTLERFDLGVVYMADADKTEGFLPLNYTNRVFCPFIEQEQEQG